MTANGRMGEKDASHARAKLFGRNAPSITTIFFYLPIPSFHFSVVVWNKVARRKERTLSQDGQTHFIFTLPLFSNLSRLRTSYPDSPLLLPPSSLLLPTMCCWR